MTDIEQRDPLPAGLAELQRLTTEAQQLAAAGAAAGADLVPTGARTPGDVKTELATQRSRLIRVTTALREQQAAVEQLLREQLSAARAALAPLQKLTQRIEEAVWTVNLYLGRDEEIVTLLDGTPAPADTPLCVRQLVLSMDEETTIAAEDGGIDFSDLTAFDAWISQPHHLQQVLPEPRGVVVLVPRRRGRDYGDPWVSAKLNDANRRSYWLIRNGECLFRMSTDFPVGDRLTPGRQEFTDFFTETRHNFDTGQTENVPIEPGTQAWLRAEEAADARRRHFMRAALILQGLVDRTTVFRPLPAEHVSLLEPASYDAGHVRLICDADDTLGTGRQPFYAWLAERNGQLRPGMRIVGAFHGQEFRSLRSRERFSYDEHERLHPPKAEDPKPGEIYTIEDTRPDGGLVIRYDRTQDVWVRDDWGHTDVRPAKKRASCTLYRRDRFVLPIDLVTVEEMRTYLEARTERHTYLDMVPLLKAAIAAKEAEAATERPFKSLLAGQIAAAHGLDLDTAAEQVDELVQWWKLTRVRHRPLVAGDDPETEGRAVREIVAEAGVRLAAAATAAAERDTENAMLARLREQIPDLMFVARTRNGGYVALTPQPRQHPAPLARDNVYVRSFTTGKTGKTLAERAWATVTPAQAARWRTIWAAPEWKNWDLTPDGAATLTDPQIDKLLATFLAALPRHSTSYWDSGKRISEPTGTPIAVTYEPAGTGKGTLLAYLDTGHDPEIPTRLLTTRIPDVEMRRVALSWHRSTGGKITHTIATRSDSVHWDASPGWRDDESPTIGPPWREQLVIWSDEPGIARLQAQAAKVLAARHRARELGRPVQAAIECVARAWEERVEAREYARFLDDFRDPALWEGHRKTLKNLTFPFRSHRDLRLLLDRFVEDGHDLTGHTVASAASLLRGTALDLPDDLLKLPIHLTHHTESA